MVVYIFTCLKNTPVMNQKLSRITAEQKNRTEKKAKIISFCSTSFLVVSRDFFSVQYKLLCLCICMKWRFSIGKLHFTEHSRKKSILIIMNGGTSSSVNFNNREKEKLTVNSWPFLNSLHSLPNFHLFFFSLCKFSLPIRNTELIFYHLLLMAKVLGPFIWTKPSHDEQCKGDCKNLMS